MKKINSEAELKAALKQNDCTVVKVGSVSCGPCRVLDVYIHEIEEENGDTAHFLEVDADEVDEKFLDSLKVRNIPVLIYYKNGEEYCRTVGVVFELDIINKVKEIKGE